MKTFKTYSAAKKFANDGPVLRVGKLYFAAPEMDPVSFGLTSVELITPKGHISGSVTLRHLERLGNANWAEASQKHGFSGSKVFNAETFK